MRFDVVTIGRLVASDGSAGPGPDVVEAFVDAFVAELEKLQADEIDISTNLVSGEISISIAVEADDMLDAQISGGSTIRSALHAGGAGTPKWSMDWVSASVSPDARLADA